MSSPLRLHGPVGLTGAAGGGAGAGAAGGGATGCGATGVSCLAEATIPGGTVSGISWPLRAMLIRCMATRCSCTSSEPRRMTSASAQTFIIVSGCRLNAAHFSFAQPPESEVGWSLSFSKMLS